MTSAEARDSTHGKQRLWEPRFRPRPLNKKRQQCHLVLVLSLGLPLLFSHLFTAILLFCLLDFLGHFPITSPCPFFYLFLQFGLPSQLALPGSCRPARLSGPAMRNMFQASADLGRQCPACHTETSRPKHAFRKASCRPTSPETCDRKCGQDRTFSACCGSFLRSRQNQIGGMIMDWRSHMGIGARVTQPRSLAAFRAPHSIRPR
jgi:hypothetical protein